ncbi:MAG TPA: galactokinase [Ktedonobacterales bacterium]|nr:galactokinase [Ktedonobacterales bacterium]
MLPEPAQRALADYREHFGRPDDTRPITVAWAPGRVNLIGEHTDYNEGLVLPVAVDRYVALAGRPTTAGATTTCYSVHHRRAASFGAARSALRNDRRRLPLFARYVRGVLAELATLPGAPRVPAFDAAIAGDVPVGGGMSSSAALTVAIATLAGALSGPALDPLDTARLCQHAEQHSTGVQVGIMDQAASCLGRPGSALFLDCRSLAYEHVPVALPDVALAVFDTGVSRSLAAVGYNERRAQCEAAVALLTAAIHAQQPARSITALRDITPGDLARYGQALPEPLLRRARHVVTENERVREAIAALRAGDAARLGALLDASHASLRDDYEVSCPELDAAVEIGRSVPGVLGARLMGAGFGGSVLLLARDDALPALKAALASAYPPRTGRIGTLHVCRIAGTRGTATLPAAEDDTLPAVRSAMP